MSQAFHRVPKNILATGVGQILGNALAFAATILAARYLGVAGFGRFTFLFGLAVVIWFIVEAGLMQILVRELSQCRDRPQEYAALLGAFRGLALAASLVLLALAALAALVLTLTVESRAILLLLALAMAAIFQSLGLASVVRAHEEMEFAALGLTLMNAGILAGVGLAVLLDAGLVGIFAAHTGTYLLLWGYYRLVVGRRYGLAPRRYDRRAWAHFLKEAVPLGLGQVLRRTANYVDIFLLTALSTLTAVGLFATAYRLILALATAAMVLSLPFLPVFSRLAADPREDSAPGLEQGFLFMLVAAVPFAVIFGIYGPVIITGLFGPQFAAAGPALQLLGVSLLFTFPGSLFLHFFTGIGKQRLWTVCAGWTLLLHLALDLALIPWLDVQGAVWATLAAEAGFFALGWYLLKNLDMPLSLGRLYPKPLGAGAAVALILHLTPGVTPAGMAARAALALLLYGLLLWLFKVFTVKGLITLMRGRPLMDEA